MLQPQAILLAKHASDTFLQAHLVPLGPIGLRGEFYGNFGNFGLIFLPMVNARKGSPHLFLKGGLLNLFPLLFFSVQPWLALFPQGLPGVLIFGAQVSRGTPREESRRTEKISA